MDTNQNQPKFPGHEAFASLDINVVLDDVDGRWTATVHPMRNAGDPSSTDTNTVLLYIDDLDLPCGDEPEVDEWFEWDRAPQWLRDAVANAASAASAASDHARG